MNINWHDKELTFEEVYPKAEFSELIQLVLVLADAGLRTWSRLKRHFARLHSAGRSQAEAP